MIEELVHFSLWPSRQCDLRMSLTHDLQFRERTFRTNDVVITQLVGKMEGVSRANIMLPMFVIIATKQT